MRRLLLALSALLASPVIAQEAAGDVACASVRVVWPAELAAWSMQEPVSAGIKPGEGAAIQPGHAALVSLHPARHLALSPAPTRPAEPMGGTLSIAITVPGTYRVALGDDAWIDLVQSGKALESIAHAHGPKCTGIRKMVDFRLAPGNYAIQLSGAPGGTIALLVVKIA